MNVESLVKTARARGASDLHIEPGLPVVVRVRGDLQRAADPLSAADTQAMAQALIGAEQWEQFLTRRSLDFSRSLAGMRCRINVLSSSHGVGLAIRLLSRVIPTIESLNLHPALREFIHHDNGLVLISGPTGSGKSSTLAAMIQEINLSEKRHIITVEEPIEYSLQSQMSLIRQREVGTHTPSFEQALVDALREDPDVLMVGEMRHPEVMRLTLNVAETGHLVFATVHSSNTLEALQRVVSSFPSEIQSAVCAQLADALLAVVAQRLHYREDLKIRIPECEILTATGAVRNLIRQGQFFKIESVLATGAKEGMFTFERYRAWMDSRTRWYVPTEAARTAAEDDIVDAKSPEPLTKMSAPSFTKPAEPVEEIIELEPSDQSIEELVSKLKQR